MKRVPIIDCTDLYHPHQDPGDNFDIVAAYALPEIDLRAVILDATDCFRRPHFDHYLYGRMYGPREPGIIPMTQMNYIFDRRVPFAVSPFTAMTSPDDRMSAAPQFQQAGVELMLKTLRESEEPLDILIFCSCRTAAVAFNREPNLFREKVRKIHISAGNTSGEVFDVDWKAGKGMPPAPGSPGYREWNVELDPHAFVCLMSSGLPVAWYPDASDDGPSALHRHTTYYQLGTLRFVRSMHPRLRSYLGYVFTRQLRHDFLLAMDEDPSPEVLDEIDSIKTHAVWETAVWLGVSGRKLVKRPEVGYRIVPPEEVLPADTVLKNDQVPCRIKEVRPDGRVDFELSDKPTGITIYDRGPDVEENERAMREALQALYLSFAPA